MKIASRTRTMKIKMRMAGIIVFVFTIMFLITDSPSGRNYYVHKILVDEAKRK